jgi:hypothetical protein
VEADVHDHFNYAARPRRHRRGPARRQGPGRRTLRQALAIKPDTHEAANNWGNDLLQVYRHVPAAEQAALLEQAERVLLQAERAKAGSGAYNLACVYGLRRDPAECAAWLRQALVTGKLNVEHMAKDADLDLVRDTPEFQAFLGELSETPTSGAASGEAFDVPVR